MNVKISVITICYNAESEIRNTMISVLEQTYDNLEYIIIDGASKDNTLNIINEVKAQYSNKDVKVFSEPDYGIYDAMNKGVLKASGEWLNMMNAGDSFCTNDVLEKVMKLDIPNTKSVLYSDNYLVYPDGKKMLIHNDLEHNASSFCHQAIIYRRSVHARHGLYVHLKKLIISDTLMFIRIPDEEKMKVDVVIANFEAGGASGKSGYTMQKQNLCANYIFKDDTFAGIIWKYYSMRIRHALLPHSLRQKIRRMLGKIDY